MKITVDAKEFYTALNLASKACGQTPAGNPALGMVEVKAEAGQVILTALDGFIMVQKMVTGLVEGPGTALLCPSQLLPALKQAKAQAIIEAAEGQIACTTESGCSTFPAFDGEFVQYARIWPGEREEITLTFNPQLAIRVLQALAGKEKGAVELRVSSQNPLSPYVIVKSDTDRALLLPVRKN